MAYLDHAATTPMLPEAVEAYASTAGSVGNASSLHAPGRRARRTVEEARERVAAALGARPSEVVFTGGGTESDNLAVKGIFWARRAADPRRKRIVAGATEHHAVLDAVEWLGRLEGAEVTWLPADELGRVAPGRVARDPRPPRRRGRPDHDDVGQQRGRHGAAGGRLRGGRGRARDPAAHGRDPGHRPGAASTSPPPVWPR